MGKGSRKGGKRTPKGESAMTSRKGLPYSCGWMLEEAVEQTIFICSMLDALTDDPDLMRTRDGERRMFKAHAAAHKAWSFLRQIKVEPSR